MHPEGDHWEATKLGCLVEFVGGYAFPDQFQGKKEGDLPFFKVSDMSAPGNHRALWRANHYVSRGLAVHQKWDPVPPGAIAFAKVGAALLLNRRRLTIKESLMDNNMLAVLPGSQVNNVWLYWWLKTVDLGRYAQSGALPSVNQAQLGALKVLLPPLPEQRQIAAILDTVDAIIHRTEQVIAKLELVKKGLLHDLLTRGIDENGELRDPERHPEQFKESELGRIPQEWEKVSLGQVLQDLYRYPTYYGIEYVEDGVPEIRGELLRDDGTISKEPTLFRYVSEQTARKFPRVRLNENDFVISVRGTIGKVARVRKSLSGAVITANLLKMRFDPTLIVPTWAEVYLLSPGFQQALDLASSATTIKTIQVPRLSAILLARPPREEQVKIAEVASTVTDRICAERANLDKLRLLKKALMDDLLTGKVRVTSLLEEEEEMAAPEAAE